MKYVIVALVGLLFISLLGDYLFWLFAFLLGAAALWCLYRALMSYQEWQMPEDKWFAKIEAEEIQKEQKKLATQKKDGDPDTATKDGVEKPAASMHIRRSRIKRTKADGFAVIMFVMMSLIPGCLSYQAVNLRDGGDSSANIPAANFTASSMAISGASVSGKSHDNRVMFLAAGLGLVFFGAASGIASVFLRKRYPQYAKPVSIGAATFFVLGGAVLALNMTGGAAKTNDNQAAVVVVSDDGKDGSTNAAEGKGDEVSAGQSEQSAAQDKVTVIDYNKISQDKAAVKQYIERENPFAKLEAAKKQSGLTAAQQNADSAVLKRYLFLLAKLSEGALEPTRIIKGAEETAKIYEEFYDSEFLLVTEWQNAKKKKSAPDDLKLADLLRRHEEAEREIRRLAEWSEAKLR